MSQTNAQLPEFPSMPIHYAPGFREVEGMTTDQLRENFLISELFVAGRLTAHYTDLDRMVIGGAMPAGPLVLPDFKETGTEFFLQRREMGVINIGAPGCITVDGVRHEVDSLDCLYIGRGARSVVFDSGGQGPSAFYFVSTPAHAERSTCLARRKDANIIALGDPKTANRRRIVQYIHEAGIQSCQLVMGFTELEEGSVWNTMPPHSHDRRTEIYLYFDLGDQLVIHLLGMPTKTRHLIVHDREATLSPSWSIHTGAGTRNYRFIWAMGGDNQRFADMDGVSLADLR